MIHEHMTKKGSTMDICSLWKLDGCQRVRKSYPGLGSRRRCRRSSSQRFIYFFSLFGTFLPFGTLLERVILMALCRTSLSSQWSWPPTPSAILLLWTSLKTTYQRCHNIGQMIFFNIGRSRQYHICHLYRFMKGYRMTWQPSRLWWREEEGNTTTLTQKMLLAASTFKHF